MIAMQLDFLREAIRLSIDKMQAGQGGPFGAVVTRDGEIIGRGWNQVTSANDPTAHAEVVAIRDACARLKTFSLAGCEIYASCEPCPLCLSAVYWSRIEHVYYAASCDDAAEAGFDDRELYRELARPAAERQIAMDQALREEALAAMRAWMSKEDRISY
jgi:tRNA(Arg) A34 adenosine deaminase TadA